MTEIISVKTTCDNCGTDIAEFSSRWIAELDERHDPNAPVYDDTWSSGAERLHICMECLQPVLGELIRKAAERSRA